MITGRLRSTVVHTVHICKKAFEFTSSSTQRRGAAEQTAQGPCGSTNLKRCSFLPSPSLLHGLLHHPSKPSVQSKPVAW